MTPRQRPSPPPMPAPVAIGEARAVAAPVAAAAVIIRRDVIGRGGIAVIGDRRRSVIGRRRRIGVALLDRRRTVGGRGGAYCACGGGWYGGAMLISAALAASGASAPSATAPAVSDSVIRLRMGWPPLRRIQTSVLLEAAAGAELELVSGGFGHFRQRAFIMRGNELRLPRRHCEERKPTKHPAFSLSWIASLRSQ